MGNLRYTCFRTQNLMSQSEGFTSVFILKEDFYSPLGLLSPGLSDFTAIFLIISSPDSKNSTNMLGGRDRSQGWVHDVMWGPGIIPG